MNSNLKIRRSAGVSVTVAVHRLLKDANQARDRREWSPAADLYARALEQDPDLTHIWIQYGHALKETGDLSLAEAAYLKAMALEPDLADAHLHLGHLYKVRGDRTAASRSYLRALELDPMQMDA